MGHTRVLRLKIPIHVSHSVNHTPNVLIPKPILKVFRGWIPSRIGCRLRSLVYEVLGSQVQHDLSRTQSIKPGLAKLTHVLGLMSARVSTVTHAFIKPLQTRRTSNGAACRHRREQENAARCKGDIHAHVMGVLQTVGVFK